MQPTATHSCDVNGMCFGSKGLDIDIVIYTMGMDQYIVSNKPREIISKGQTIAHERQQQHSCAHSADEVQRFWLAPTQADTGVSSVYST